MLKGLMQLMLGEKNFEDRSGVYARCGCGLKKTIRTGDADSFEIHVSQQQLARDMNCRQCKKYFLGCSGPEKEIRTA